MRHDKFLQKAIRIAEASTCHKRHGCVVVTHGRVVGIGTNISKGDPAFSPWESCQIHAEIVALKRAGWPSKADVYCARINRRNEPVLSKPCFKCQIVLDTHGYTCYYTT
jgi:pyrimidine deaminase RibD-like protein